MNWMALAVDGVAGFLVSLVVAAILRRGLGYRWPVQEAGFRIETRVLPWLLTLAAGPALLYDATADQQRQGLARPLDLLAAGFVLVIWSGSYGHCVASIARLLL